MLVAADNPHPPRCHLLGTQRLHVSELVAGGEVSVTFERDGASCTMIGRVVSIRRRMLELAPWGGGVISINRIDVQFARLLNPHAWAERREIGERQRRGECGLPAETVRARSVSKGRRPDGQRTDRDDRA